MFTVEMDRYEIAKAPSFSALNSIMRTYLKTGIMANKLAVLLGKWVSELMQALI